MSSDVVHHPGFLSLAEQRSIARQAFRIEPGFYRPVLANGSKMHVRMNGLGWHWSAITYEYSRERDVDGQPAAAIPTTWQRIARRALRVSGFATGSRVASFDVCLVNWYDEIDGRMGLHRDNSEQSDAPVVSLSIGATAIFLMGGLKRTDPTERIDLASGDLLVFGRSRRWAYHGVRRLIRGTTPEKLGLPEAGRLNLTFRRL
jgi:alkylated DNA repair protein (DNA oxidative demethylase)